MKRFLMTSFLIALTASGCAASVTAVPVKGKDAAVFKMRGEWVGDYTSPDTGRSGTIRFVLKPGRKTADGEVAMNMPGGESRLLRIAVLRIEGEELHGRLERYSDPACKCDVDTDFVGTMTDEAINGQFVTTPVGTDKQLGGTWHVERTVK